MSSQWIALARSIRYWCRHYPAGGHRLSFSGDGGPATDAGAVGILPLWIGRITSTSPTGGNYRIRRIDAKTGLYLRLREAENAIPKATADQRSRPDQSIRIASPLIMRATYSSLSMDTVRTAIVFDVWMREPESIETVAGLADADLSGAGRPALATALQSLSSLLFDSAGNLYFVDPINGRVRCIDAMTHTIRLIAGSTKGFSGDGGPANRACLNNPSSIALDSHGNLYIADYVNQRIRSVERRSGTIHTVAGNGLPVRHDVQL